MVQKCLSSREERWGLLGLRAELGGAWTQFVCVTPTPPTLACLHKADEILSAGSAVCRL